MLQVKQAHDDAHDFSHSDILGVCSFEIALGLVFNTTWVVCANSMEMHFAAYDLSDVESLWHTKLVESSCIIVQYTCAPTVLGSPVVVSQSIYSLCNIVTWYW